MGVKSCRYFYCHEFVINTTFSLRDSADVMKIYLNVMGKQCNKNNDEKMKRSKPYKIKSNLSLIYVI